MKTKIPNILTIGRIILIPVLVWGILSLTTGADFLPAMPWMVLGLFGLCAFTDFLDGFLARRWQVTSDFGRMIDPIADKLLVAGCLIAIAIAMRGDGLILAPALAIIGRDILVSGAREHAALSSRVMPPTKLAKWKTAFEMLAIAVLVAYLSLGWQNPAEPFIENEVLAQKASLLTAGIALLWFAAILSVYTGSLYFRAALKD